MKIVFFGTPHFAVGILDELLSSGFSVVAVVTKPDQPQGRSLKLKPSPVKQYLLERVVNIPILQPEKAADSHFIEMIREFLPDFFVVVGYGEILKQALLDVPKFAPINIHTSLLPSYRGAAPIQRAMMAGEKVMGITVMKMNAKMDAGEILLQSSTEVNMNDPFEVVEAKLIELSKESIKKVLSDFSNYSMHAKTQDLSLVSHAPKIEIEDCLIDCSKNYLAVQRQIMALSPKPSAFLLAEVQGEEKRIKILEAVVSENKVDCHTIQLIDQKMFLGCEGGSVQIIRLQPEGKNSMSAKDFINGHKLFFPIKIKF
jgi:methionyl-tRNA formyltransferase